MKLLTKKETDQIFDLYSWYNPENWLMDAKSFNEAVNHILHDEVLVKKMKERLVKIQSKLK